MNKSHSAYLILCGKKKEEKSSLHGMPEKEVKWNLKECKASLGSKPSKSRDTISSSLRSNSHFVTYRIIYRQKSKAKYKFCTNLVSISFWKDFSSASRAFSLKNCPWTFQHIQKIKYHCLSFFKSIIQVRCSWRLYFFELPVSIGNPLLLRMPCHLESQYLNCLAIRFMAKLHTLLVIYYHNVEALIY